MTVTNTHLNQIIALAVLVLLLAVIPELLLATVLACMLFALTRREALALAWSTEQQPPAQGGSPDEWR